MLPIIAILEKKSFLHKDGKWQEMKMDSKEHGDLFALEFTSIFSPSIWSYWWGTQPFGFFGSL